MFIFLQHLHFTRVKIFSFLETAACSLTKHQFCAALILWSLLVNSSPLQEEENSLTQLKFKCCSEIKVLCIFKWLTRCKASEKNGENRHRVGWGEDRDCKKKWGFKTFAVVKIITYFSLSRSTSSCDTSDVFLRYSSLRRLFGRNNLIPTTFPIYFDHTYLRMLEFHFGAMNDSGYYTIGIPSRTYKALIQQLSHISSNLPH